MEEAVIDIESKVSLERQFIRQIRALSEQDYMSALIRDWLDDNILDYDQVEADAKRLIKVIQSQQSNGFSIENLWVEYDLSGKAGADLLCLAEALLRIPDTSTRRRFVTDRVQRLHLAGGNVPSWLSEFSTLGLGLSKYFLPSDDKKVSIIGHASASVLDAVMLKFVTHMAKYFILAESFESALKHAAKLRASHGYGFSFDMLGEAAYTEADAERYFLAYQSALETMVDDAGLKCKGSGISIKLSAITTRFEFSQRNRVVPILVDRVTQLCFIAKKRNITIIMDAEEADCLELSLDVLELVYQNPDLQDYQGLGIAIQAYQKRASAVIDWLSQLAKKHAKCLPCRLVKGAYWDTEIKLAQVHGYHYYDVLTRKSNTDLNYLACARQLKDKLDYIYPQFATHNAQTIIAISHMMGNETRYEFQRLFGMGETLFNHLIQNSSIPVQYSIYAPVGAYKDLLPYLARRMLENGANTSFVHQVAKRNTDMSSLIQHPYERVKQYDGYKHPKIPLPTDLYFPRKNSLGTNLNDFQNFSNLFQAAKQSSKQIPRHCASLVAFTLSKSSEIQVLSNPAKRHEQLTQIIRAQAVDVDSAIFESKQAFEVWSGYDVTQRAEYLRNTADLLEARTPYFCWLLIAEAGKTWADAVDEVREAVDFLRYYADEAERLLVNEQLPGPTGEENSIERVGRGIFVCISPWNFPLAIFTGQISAALVSGNTVIAKPASQTPLVAHEMIKLFYQAGVDRAVLQLLIGSVKDVGQPLIAHEQISGVMLTGSTQTAQKINLTLASRQGAIVPLIAETGGQNAMIVDSSALLEQVVTDVIDSAFRSCGQRCSALRILLVQEEIADDLLTMLSGAMQTLQVDDPLKLSTDVGPVIDAVQCANLQKHVDYLNESSRLIAQSPEAKLGVNGSFFRPIAYEIEDLSILKEEVFGPILHVLRYKHGELDQLCDTINQMQYGLTFGVHTRIQSFYQYLSKRIRVGNVYVNRNIIGAQVGVQPFGGQGLSGTGPKAGGPFYLTRLCHEKTISNNTAALGGNASLMALED